MKIAGKKVWYLEYILIIVGTGLMATAITSCFDAAGMVTGGFSGIAILVKAWTKGLYGDGIPLWVTNLVLNVPLFLLAAKIKGFKFVKKALLGDLSLTIWLAILPAWKLSGDFLLVALYGGLLQGIGIGCVFLGGGTTGGTDLLAAIIQCEAGGEPYSGQLAVGAVVMNRVKSGSFPNSISGVIYQSGQFTPASSGKLARVLSSGNISSSCYQAAAEALSGADNTGGAKYFHAGTRGSGTVIGSQIFY